MNLVMFTPAVAPSAIGRMAAMVTAALLEGGHSVRIVRSESVAAQDERTHDFRGRLIPWQDEAAVQAALDWADATVYQVGDNFEFHEGCLHWMPRRRGVMCLHDFFLGHLFAGWMATRTTEAQALLARLYGSEVASSYPGWLASPEFIDKTLSTAPMTEWLARLALGTVTHSQWGTGRILAACPGPVRVVPLAYSAPPLGNVPARREGDADFRVLTVGHVNPNKRAESVIAAIAQSEKLRGSTRYRLVGAVQPQRADHLRGLAGTMGVRLQVDGAVEAAELSRALAEADVVCCLRWPTLEAASASTIEAMLAGKVVVVADTGFYAELPDDCVRKIRPELEIEDLKACLEQLQADPKERQQLAQRGAAWAKSTFTAANYARELVAHAAICLRAWPTLEAVEGIAGTLSAWGGLSDADLRKHVAAPLELLG